MSDLKATSIAFEKRYSDDSGVEFGVRLAPDAMWGDKIEFAATESTASFPIDLLSWLMAALARIDAERPRLSISEAIRQAMEKPE